MKQLVDAFAGLDATRRVLEALGTATHRAAGGLWGGSSSLLIATLISRRPGPLLVVCAEDEDAVRAEADFQSFAGAPGLLLPRQATDPDGLPESASQSARVRCLLELRERPQWVLFTSLEALVQKAPSVDALTKGRLLLKVGERQDRLHLLGACRDAGLRQVPVVIAPGEVSLRGDVLDVFPIAMEEAIRIELFDDEIESIRSFSPSTQSSVRSLEQVTLTLGGSVGGDAAGREAPVLSELHRSDLAVLWLEPLRIDERRRSLILHTEGAQTELVALQETLAPLPSLEVSSLPSHDLDFRVLSAGTAAGSGESDPLGRLRSIRGYRGQVTILCRTEAERQRLEQIFAHKDVSLDGEQIELRVGALSRGFRLPDLERTFLSNVEFAGVPVTPKVKERVVVPSKAIASFFELGPGDLVVHAVHGIAYFEDIERVRRGEDSEEDHMRLCFRDEVRLLVPVSKIHLIQKYIGAGGDARPKLDKLGGRGFARRKEEVEKSLYDLSAELLEVQSRRERIQRDPYPADDLEEEFLDGFPFQDTDDQVTCWKEIRGDLEQAHPMDRLLCGDVGFGKTELAMRAAFRVALSGRQVAVLVPTTVLAEQHGRTFSARFAPLGMRVEVLSRFRKGKKKTEILTALANGKIDVLVGTQRILSEDVDFADLGLAVVDEEQRFGVRQKEHLKSLRLSVDVLSMSATPIPRTLHGSLLGIRNISTLSTPPTGRQDVETRVAFGDDELVQVALQRELDREGQAFVLHNRISGLEPLAARLQRLVPDARINIGHGQMTSTQMEATIREFMRGEADILLCTTIVENGLDIPNANTILIDRAEMFGLAELHQLRGRVGRSDRQAYCYLLMDRAQPPGQDGRRRLKALEEFSNLGAGFAIAMKDLEIRGAGNLLGPQQSGHIAAVGYEMYCELLAQAVAEARSGGTPGAGAPGARRSEALEVDVDLGLRAYLPDDFLADPKGRLELLREMDRATDAERALAIREDLGDRFGRLPVQVDNLLGVFLLKHLLTGHGVLGLQRVDGDRIVVRHPPGQPLGGAWLDHFAELRQVEAGKTHLILPRRRRGGGWNGEQLLQHLLGALCGSEASRTLRAWQGSGRSGNNPRSRSRSPS